jgi:hypothetical protein
LVFLHITQVASATLQALSRPKGRKELGSVPSTKEKREKNIKERGLGS